MKVAVGELIENRVIVWDRDDARRLYSMGFYGKPLGISKPKGISFDAPLVLDLLEAYHLVKEELLRVVDRSGRTIDPDGLKKRCSKEYSYFEEKFRVYEELRRAGFIVSAGMKFGSDFAVYEKGPGIDHAPFLVHVLRPEHKITANYVVLAGRLATTVRKQFVLAIANKRRSDSLVFEWWRL